MSAGRFSTSLAEGIKLLKQGKSKIGRSSSNIKLTVSQISFIEEEGLKGSVSSINLENRKKPLVTYL